MAVFPEVMDDARGLGKSINLAGMYLVAIGRVPLCDLSEEIIRNGDPGW